MLHNTLKKFIITAAVLLVTGICVQVLQTSYEGKAEKHLPAFPGLYGKLTDISHINIKNSLFEFNLRQDDKIWTIEELDGYPADIRRINSLLQEMAMMLLLEEKPFHAEAFIAMKLLDKNSSGEIRLYDSQDKEMAGMVVGARKNGISGALLGTYIRKFDDQKAYLADTTLDVTGSALNWTDASILDIHSSHIDRIEMEQTIVGLKNDLSNFLSGLAFVDVRREKNYKEKLVSVNKIKFILKNRLEITVEALLSDDDAHFIRISSLLEGNVVRKEASAIHNHIETKHKGWLYQIPQSKFVSLLPNKGDR